MMIDIEQSPEHGENSMSNSGEDIPEKNRVSWPLAFERSWPYLVGILTAITYRLFAWNIIAPAGFNATLSAVEDFAGTMAGFMATAVGILVAVSGSRFTRQAKQAGVYTNVVQYMLTSMGWLSASAVLSMFYLSLDLPTSKPWWGPHAMITWISVAMIALATLIRVLRAFSKMMKYIAED